MAEDHKIREALKKYVRFTLFAFAQTAACNRLHHLEKRYCRWLLMAPDKALSDKFLLTHEFLAMMLRIQGTGVSIAQASSRKPGL
jgi:hypothetical protein